MRKKQESPPVPLRRFVRSFDEISDDEFSALPSSHPQPSKFGGSKPRRFFDEISDDEFSALPSSPPQPSKFGGSKPRKPSVKRRILGPGLLKRRPVKRTTTPNSTPSSNSDASPTRTPPAKRPRKEKAHVNGAASASNRRGRLWGEGDEIVLLEGVLQYRAVSGADPLSNSVLFYDFVKGSLPVNVSRRQLTDKIRKLKTRYMQNLRSSNKKNRCDQTVFALSAKIWGKNAAEEAESDSQSSSIKTNGEDDSAKEEAENGEEANANEPVENADDANANEEVPEMNREEISLHFVGQSSISMGLDANIVRVGLGMCSDVDKAAMEEKWKQFYLEESGLFLRKLDLAREESKMIREALKSQGK